MTGFRRRYGAGPGHLVACALGLLVAAYGVTRIVQQPDAFRILAYLVAAVVAHDLVLLPLYTLLYAAGWRALGVDRDPARRVPILRHLLVPASIAAVLFLVWFPLVLALPSFRGIFPGDGGVYAGRWALVGAVLFGGSAVLYGVRALRAGGLPRGPAAR